MNTTLRFVLLPMQHALAVIWAQYSFASLSKSALDIEKI
jgi:hypothetical protein